MAKTDEVIINLKINNRQAAHTLNELESDARILREQLKKMNPEVDKAEIVKLRAEYDKVTERVMRVRDEIGLLRKKVEEPIDPKSLSGLEKKAQELKKGLAELNPEVDKAKFEKLKAEYDGVQTEIDETKIKLGLLERKIETPIDPKSLSGLEKKAQELKKDLSALNPEVDKAKFDKLKSEYDGVQNDIGKIKNKLGETAKASNQVGEAFKQMATAAFWIALIQQAYELAKAFFEVQKEINGLQTQISKMTGTTGKELDQMVGKTQGISKAFEVEAKEVNDAANSISKNMKISFGEAQDLIKKGLAASAETDKGELLQWYEEYASALSNTGIKADEFVATISQMKEQGVWDDFLIDGFKEFGIRASTDLGKVVAGLKGVEKATGTVFAEQMGKDIESGKISVMDALKQISGELAKLPPESNVAKQAIAEVFGSKGEDLGAGVIQAYAKTKNATDYLNQSTKGYNAQLDQLIESQQTLTATQSELFGKMQSGSKMIDILTNKALTVLFRTLILVYENSQPLVDIWNEWKTSSQNMGKELLALLRSFGLFKDESSAVKTIIEILVGVMRLAILPFRILSAIVTQLSASFRYVRSEISEFFDSIYSASPRLQNLSAKLTHLGEIMDRFSATTLGKNIGNWFKGIEDGTRKAQEATDAVGALGAKMGELIKGKIKPEATPTEKKETETKNLDNTKDTNSQAYQDYLQKQKDAKAKADEEAKKKAEEIAKAQADIDKKLEEARLEAITNENERKIAQLEAQAKQELEAFNKSKATDAQKAEYKRLVEEKLSKEIKEIRQKEMDELTAMARQQIIDEENAKKEVRETILKSNVELAQENLDKANQNVDKLDKPENELVDKTAALQAQFEAENALKQAQFDLELETLAGQDELKLALKTEFDNAELEFEKAHADALIAEKMRVAQAQVQSAQMIFGTMAETTQAIVDLFGEQTEAGRAAAIAMKAFSAGEIIASSIVEIQKIWEFANADATNVVIPGWRYALAAVQTAGVLARRAKSLGELASIKFAKGGFLSGRSHAQGGIRGTGSFANIEVEGGEYITRKRATDLNLPVLEAINKYGDQIDFSSMLRFATGGQIPNTTPSSAVVEAIRTPEANPMGEAMLQAIIEMGQKLDSYEREKQVVVNYSNIESAGDKMAAVRDY